MATQQNIISKVRKFAREFADTEIDLKKVILFGSYAKNMQNEYSDIDVALVADEFTGVGFIDIKKFVKILKNYIQIQAKTYSSEDFAEGDPFIEEIINTGIEIKF